MSVAGRLLRSDRLRKPPGSPEDDQDAGRRVRRGGEIGRPYRGAVMTNPVPPDLEARGITKRFGPLTALKDVHLILRSGRFHALLGENGAGKSTLVKCIMGYYRPDGGEILLDRQ